MAKYRNATQKGLLFLQCIVHNETHGQTLLSKDHPGGHKSVARHCRKQMRKDLASVTVIFLMCAQFSVSPFQ